MDELQQRLLIVDDDESIVTGLIALLEEDYETRSATTGRKALVTFAEFSPDVVLLDMQLPDANGIDLLQQFKSYSETSAVIMMSGVGTFERVVEAMKLGAESFLQKPFDYDALKLTLASVQRMQQRQRELTALKRSGVEPERLPGISPAIQQLNATLGHIARATSPVLIGGESGTGKGVFARLLHQRSPRAQGPFVDLNCAGLSRELLESELFGHEKGAFTSATATKQGLFEIASDGTLFLDEIGEMDIAIQARLLKSIEDKRFRRVGGVRDLTANFRLIAATNRNLPDDVASGRFRKDLFYRLNVVNVLMPPLRERPEDVPLMVEVLMKPLRKELGCPRAAVSPRAMDKLAKYPWPGNIRELRNVLERALLTMRYDEIRSEDVILPTDVGDMAPRSGDSGPATEWEIRPLDDVSADYVVAAVKAAGGNMRKAARQLKISPSTLYAKTKGRL